VREPDEEYIAFFEQRLSSTMSRRIRPDRLPNEAKLNERAKLIFSDATTPLTVADAERARRFRDETAGRSPGSQAMHRMIRASAGSPSRLRSGI